MKGDDGDYGEDENDDDSEAEGNMMVIMHRIMIVCW